MTRIADPRPLTQPDHPAVHDGTTYLPVDRPGSSGAGRYIMPISDRPPVNINDPTPPGRFHVDPGLAVAQRYRSGMSMVPHAA